MHQKPLSAALPPSAARDGQYAPLGPDSHPFADLRRLAAYFDSSTIPQASPADMQAAHPAGIALFAEKLGLKVTLEERAVAQLQNQDLPAIVMLGSGASRLVLAREKGDRFILGVGEGVLEVSVEALARVATGAVFRLHRADPAPSAAPTLSSRAALRFVMPLLLREKGRLVHLALAGWLINLLGLALPFFSMAVFDRVIPHAAYETLFALAAGVVLALALEFALRDARLSLADAVGQNIALKVQERLASRMLFARLDDLPASPAPLLQAMPDMDALAHALPQLVVGALVDLPFFLLLLALVASIGGPVVAVPALGVVALALLHLLAHTMSARAHTENCGAIRRQSQLAMEASSLRERIRATGLGAMLLGRWSRNADDLGYVAHKMRHWQGIAVQGSAVLVQAILVGVIVVGAFQIGAAAMTVGALSACTLLLNRIILPISQLIGTSFRCVQLARSVSTQLALIEAEPESGTDKRFADAASVTPQLEAHHVSFRYKGEQRRALQDVSLTIKPGERIGIIGKTGCGKSSLLKLFLRLHSPESGKILLGSHDIHHFDPAALRRLISYMPQEPMLFEGTLEENLTAGLRDVDRARFEAVCRLSGVHDFASLHPSGYSLEVGPRGQALSGGERQSVTLARALMEHSAFYVLDEPTSAMDNGLEARLIAELGTITGEAGLIIATHRLPLLKLVDRIIWLDGGRVVADGPRGEIFAKLGLAA